MPRLVGYWLHPVMLCWKGCQVAASVSELIYIGALVQLYCSRIPQQVAHLTLACILAGFCESTPPGFDADLCCLGALRLALVAPRVAALHLISSGPMYLPRRMDRPCLLQVRVLCFLANPNDHQFRRPQKRPKIKA